MSNFSQNLLRVLNRNVISSEGSHDTSARQMLGHSLYALLGKPRNFPFDLFQSQNGDKMGKSADRNQNLISYEGDHDI